MEVILLEKIRNLGTLGDRVTVTRGYGRNYLIPKSKAVYATDENVVKFDQRRADLEKNASVRHEKAVTRQQAIEAIGAVTIAAKAGEEGKLFGSIGTRDISNALTKAGIIVEKREIRMPSGTLRMIGEYELSLELDSDVTAIVKIVVVPEGGAASREE